MFPLTCLYQFLDKLTPTLTLAFITSFISIIFIFFKHPLAIAAVLIFQVLINCLLLSLVTGAWFAYILFLIYMGAVLVLFVYISALASNEKFEFRWWTLGKSVFLASAFFSSLIVCIYIFGPISFSVPPELLLSPEFQIKPVYRAQFPNITSFIILYLLLSLLVVVKITSVGKGSLKSSKK